MATVVLGSASPSRLQLLRQAGIEPLVMVCDADEEAAKERLRATYGESPELVAQLALIKARNVASRLPYAHPDLADAVVIGCDSMLRLDDGQLVGKPYTPEGVLEHWRRVRGRSAQLITGHAMIRLSLAGTGGSREASSAGDSSRNSADSNAGNSVGSNASGETGLNALTPNRGQSSSTDIRNTTAGSGDNSGEDLVIHTVEAHAVTGTTVYFGNPTDDQIRRYAATGEPLYCAGAFTLEARGSWFVDSIEGDPSNVIGLSIPTVGKLAQSLGIDPTELWNIPPGD